MRIGATVFVVIASVLNGISSIFGVSHPLKIVNAIVRSLFVAVVNDGFAFGIRDKGSRNESVDFASFPNFVFAQNNVLIAAFIETGSKQAFADSVETFDASHGADLVVFFASFMFMRIAPLV